MYPNDIAEFFKERFGRNLINCDHVHDSESKTIVDRPTDNLIIITNTFKRFLGYCSSTSYKEKRTLTITLKPGILIYHKDQKWYGDRKRLRKDDAFELSDADIMKLLELVRPDQ